MILAAVLFATSLLAGSSRPAPQAGVQWEPYKLETDGSPIEAQIGRLKVPERRGVEGSRLITVAFVRIPSTSAAPGAPIVYLDGGPGGSGVGAARVPALASLFRKLRGTADVILLSQRGAGLSDRIGCRGGTPPPEDTFVSAKRMIEDAAARQRACAASLRAQGVDLAGYNTEENADDVNAVRQALGAERVSLLGFSYGTHLALSVLRRHGDRIERVVLAGVEGPDDTLKYPDVFDQQVLAIAEQLKSDPRATRLMPDFPGALRSLLAHTRVEPLKVTVTVAGATRQFGVGADGILALLRRDIGDTNDIPWIPAFVYDTAGGDLTRLTRLLERRVPAFESGVNMMATAMDCASGASAERLAEIRRQEPASIFGSLTNFPPYPNNCSAAQIAQLGDGFRAPVESPVPALFISGTLDSNTPLAQAERVLRGFPNGSHLVVENAGHESTFTEAVRDRITAFMAGGRVASERLAGERIRFELPRQR